MKWETRTGSFPSFMWRATNGKGSVCAFLTSLYRNAGFRTGTFISPHLVTVRERFLLNNEMVSPGKLQAAFETVLETVNIMKEKGYSHPGAILSFFFIWQWRCLQMKRRSL